MIAARTISLPQLAWYGDVPLEIEYPDNWDVTVCEMAGYDAPALEEDAIRRAFANPIGSPPLRELARGRRDVVVLFDDLTRPTPCYQLVPYVLEELAEAGIPDNAIRFIAATGSHRPLVRHEFVKKLGEGIVERFPVYNHNPYENCIPVGTTSLGTPVLINKEVMACDLKVGIGSIVPHVNMGYGGGPKLMVPGVASIDTVAPNHAMVRRVRAEGPEAPVGWGRIHGNPAQTELEEAAKLAGFDFKVDAILNIKREIIGLFVGEPGAEHREGVKMAREVYRTLRPGPVDIVISNAYAKSSEGYLAARVGAQLLTKEAPGDLVVIVNTPEGQVTHYLVGGFGRTIGGRLHRPETSLLPSVRRLILMSPYIDRASWDHYGPEEGITVVKRWEDVLRELRRDHPYGARVAVIPDGTIQLFP